MTRPAGRRKVRKRKVKSENSGVKLGVIAVIMLLAVLLGFLTARFIIGPIIGYNADESEIRLAEDRANEENKEKEEAVNTVPSEGYALQFGAFSTEEAAMEFSSILKEKGIETEVIHADDVFKVISHVTDKKEDILSALEQLKEKEITDVFITSFK